MGILDIARGRETDGDRTPDTDAEATDAEEVDTEERTGGGNRRWLVLLGLVAIAAVAYLVSRKRAAREAEFTEIELEPTEPESESESASTE
jgi:LPXTG-motif cell wall-anchored protein